MAPATAHPKDAAESTTSRSAEIRRHDLKLSLIAEILKTLGILKAHAPVFTNILIELKAVCSAEWCNIKIHDPGASLDVEVEIVMIIGINRGGVNLEGAEGQVTKYNAKLHGC
ncbi:hypothetical protein E4U21_000844 [Claviceps maximensis]|nr:hypothetical protein E4U21_000844 [Claviceps maximensis]